MRHWPLVISSLALAAAVTACRENPEVRKQRYVESGDKFAASSNHAEAVIEYRNAVNVDPRFGEARLKLAKEYTQIGDLRNALAEYVRAADLMPDNVEAQLGAGNGLLVTGKFPEAKARAEKALEVDPKNAQALILLGNALGALKDIDSAITRVQEAVDADPQEVMAYGNLGALELVKGNRAAAEAAFKRATEVNPTSPDAHLALGNFYWAMRQPDEAEQAFKKALELDPKSPNANRVLAVFYAAKGSMAEHERYLKAYADISPELTPKLALADLYVRLKRVTEAQAQLETLAATPEGFIPATLRLASIDFVANSRDQAYARVEDVLKRDAKNSSALLHKGRFLLSDRKFAEAKTVAAQLVAQEPADAHAQYLYGLALRAAGSRDEAVKAFQAVLKVSPSSTPAMMQLVDLQLALGNTAAAADLAGQAVKAMPNSPLAHLLLGEALLRQGDLTGAEREVATLERVSRGSPEISTFIGQFYLRKNNLSRAQTAFEQALAANRESTDAFAGLIGIDLMRGRVADARRKVEARLANAPNDESMLLLAGKVFVAADDMERAESAYRQILAQSPGNFEVYGRLAGIYRVQNRLEEARKQYSELAQRNPKMAAPATAMIGTIFEMQGKRSDAIAEYVRALAFDPELAMAANNLAWLYAEDGKLDEALALAQNAKKNAPNSAFVSDTLGWIYYKKGLVSTALVSLEEAAKLTPTNPTIHYHLGLAYATQGERPKARNAFEQALKLDPAFPEAADARKQLAAL